MSKYYIVTYDRVCDNFWSVDDTARTFEESESYLQSTPAPGMCNRIILSPLELKGFLMWKGLTQDDALKEINELAERQESIPENKPEQESLLWAE